LRFCLTANAELAPVRSVWQPLIYVQYVGTWFARPVASDCVTRSERFPLRVPIRYRPVGSGTWSNGTTENISAEGVLVRCGDLPGLHVALDFRFEVKVGANRSEVACVGEVVRMERAAQGEGMFAATIRTFTFDPPDR
jgi:hypothetical protein